MDFLQFASERGLTIRHLEHGRWARVPTVDHPNSLNGAYWFGGEFGHVQNWAKMDCVESWRDGKERTQIEQEAMQRRIEGSRNAYAKERAEKQLKAASKAKWILGQCEISSHAYLDSKGFPDLRLNVWRREDQDSLLVIPMFFRSEICGVQLIGIDGSKKFLSGQRTNDATFTIGQTGRDFIVEGVASGYSLNAILSAAKVLATIHITYSVNNASRLAKRLPGAVWIADRDHSGVGQTAAAESGLQWWASPLMGEDVNDFHRRVGLFAAVMEIKKVLHGFKKCI